MKVPNPLKLQITQKYVSCYPLMLDTSADTGRKLLALSGTLSITFCLIPNSSN